MILVYRRHIKVVVIINRRLESAHAVAGREALHLHLHSDTMTSNLGQLLRNYIKVAIIVTESISLLHLLRFLKI